MDDVYLNTPIWAAPNWEASGWDVIHNYKLIYLGKLFLCGTNNVSTL